MQQPFVYKNNTSLQARMAFTMILLTALYLAFAFFLYRYTHLGAFIYVFPLVMLFGQYFFSDKLVLATSRAKIVTAEQAPGLHRMVSGLAQRAGLPMPKVAIVPGMMPNAFATGRNASHAVVAVTEGLLQQLSQPEIEAVVAHEMTHIRNRDMVVMTMAGSFAAVASWIVQMSFWMGLGGNRDNRDNSNSPFALILLASFVVSIVSHLLVLALSRYREYGADFGSAQLTGSPRHLESALMRISGSMQGVPTRELQRAEPLSALYFAAPKRPSFGELFSDHPSMEKRIARLRELERR